MGEQQRSHSPVLRIRAQSIARGKRCSALVTTRSRSLSAVRNRHEKQSSTDSQCKCGLYL